MAGRLATGFAAALAAALLPGMSRASPFPTRGGEVGLLDVPTADTAGTAGGLVGGELRLDRTPGRPTAFGPLPLSLVFGLSDRLDGGLAMREGGQPGDAPASAPVFSAATKLRLAQASGLWPGLAASVTLDSFNLGGVLGGRLVASTADIGRLRLAAYAGAEGHGPRPLAVGPTAGLAVSVIHRSDLETVLEATTSPRGPLVGGAFRWSVTPKVGVSLGLSWLPDVRGFRVSLGFGLAAAPARPARRAAAPVEAPVAAAPVGPTGPAFLDDRPHFRMRITSAATRPPDEHRHLQHGPFAGASRGAATERPARIARTDPEAVRAAELALAAETLEGRAVRLRSAEGALAARQERQAAESTRLDRQERELARLAERLEARERNLRAPGRPSPAEIALADTEEQLRASASQASTLEASLREDLRRALARERELAAAERALEPAGTAARKLLEGKGAEPLAARAGAVEARRALLGATEARLAAARDRLDVAEKGLEARAARLDVTRRRLAAQEERLAAVQKRLAARSSAPPLPAPPAATPAPAPGASADMLAAAVILLPSADQPLAARDRDAVAEMARLAAKEKVELLVWARAQNPGLMETAARRAEEIKGVAAAAGLPASRIGTRVTLRPSTEGVDVVVSPVRAPAPPAGGAR